MAEEQDPQAVEESLATQQKQLDLAQSPLTRKCGQQALVLDLYRAEEFSKEVLAQRPGGRDP